MSCQGSLRHLVFITDQSMSSAAPVFHRRNRPTQKDIARELGISQATVAMALNSQTQRRLLPQTVALVQAKAKEMNYSPQRHASILRSGRSHTIGVIFVSSLYHAPQQRVKCLASAAIAAGYQLVAADVEWFSWDISQAAEYLKGVAAEGVVLCNLSEDILLEWEKVVHNWPVAFMGVGAEGGQSAHSDMEDAFYRMTLHHLEQGSRHLTLLLPFYDSQPGDGPKMIRHRVNGFRKAIVASGGKAFADDTATGRLFDLPDKPPSAGCPISGRVVYSRRTDKFNSAFELGAWYVQSLLDRGEPLPDSLVCTNDEIAAGALKTCLQQGIRIPATVRVSGADDAPFSRFCGIPISTVRQPSKAIADFCIRTIAKMIEQPTGQEKPQEKRFPCELVYRESTTGEVSI